MSPTDTVRVNLEGLSGKNQGQKDKHWVIFPACEMLRKM